ncbi:MAG TPA: hypothetical protein VID50_05340, partial [Candidatus Eisenbacteria bacterium]
TVDDGIELLTGVKAGDAGADGRFPEGTVNGLVSQTLRRFAESFREFAAGGSAAGPRKTRRP